MDIKSTMSTLGFGHKDCRHIVIDCGGELWLAMMPVAVGGFLTMGMSRLPGSLRVEPLEGGEAVPFRYTATEAMLELETDGGARYRLAIDSETRAIRLTGTGALRLNGVETASMATTLNGEAGVRISIGAVTYFIAARRGSYTFDDTWQLHRFQSVTPVYEITPEDGEIDLCIFDLPADTPVPECAKSPEACAAETAAAFAAFTDSLVGLPEEWADVREKLAYPLWLGHRSFEDGRRVIVKSKYNSTVANARLMSFASLAFRDPVKALDLILSCPAEPIIGLAVARLADEGLLNDARGEIYRAIEALDRLARYWTDERAENRDGLCFYAYRFESGLDRSPEFFRAGEPVLAPDLNAYLVLVCETLGRLAGMEYDLGPARKWTERSRALLKALTDELWNGEAFVGKNPYTGETSGPDEALSAVPLVLGGRLPPEIAAKLPVEAADSPEHCLMAAGAFDAGRRDEVRAMTRRALEAVRAGTADDPFYGAALLWLAHKVL